MHLTATPLPTEHSAPHPLAALAHLLDPASSFHGSQLDRFSQASPLSGSSAATGAYLAASASAHLQSARPSAATHRTATTTATTTTAAATTANRSHFTGSSSLLNCSEADSRADFVRRLPASYSMLPASHRATQSFLAACLRAAQRHHRCFVLHLTYSPHHGSCGQLKSCLIALSLSGDAALLPVQPAPVS